MPIETYDIAIIGAGPVGMAATYYAGTRGLKPIIIDTLTEMGGQCTTLYPEKMIYDVASQPGCTGAELVSQLKKQLDNVTYNARLGVSVSELVREQGNDGAESWLLNFKEGDPVRVKSVIVAIGKGSFEPRKLAIAGEELAGVHYTVKKLDVFANKNILVVGGGDSAVDWSLALKGKAKSLVHIHRRDEFRAHGASLEQLREAAIRGELELITPYELRSIQGEAGQVSGATIFEAKTKVERNLVIEAVIVSTGFNPQLGSLSGWGLELEDNKILVDPFRGFATNLPGVFSIGDIAHFEGKVELIVTGFGEAATAAYYAYQHIHGAVKGAAWCAKLPV